MKTILTLLLVSSLSTPIYADPIEECLFSFMDEYHLEMGEDRPITQDQIDEWEYECARGGYPGPGSRSYSDEPEQPTHRPNPKLRLKVVNADYGTKIVVIDSGEDRLTINKVVVNRGNCKVAQHSVQYLSAYPFPDTIGFGQQARVPITSSCNVMEIELHVNGVVVTYAME